MDVKQITKKRKELESKILDLIIDPILEFERETEVRITGMGMSTCDVTEMGGLSKSIMTDFRLRIEL